MLELLVELSSLPLLELVAQITDTSVQATPPAADVAAPAVQDPGIVTATNGGIATILATMLSYAFYQWRQTAKRNDPETQRKFDELKEAKLKERDAALLDQVRKIVQEEVENKVSDAIEGLRDEGKHSKLTYELVRELHKWHDREDASGVKIWYLPREELKSMATAAETLSKVLRDQLALQRDA